MGQDARLAAMRSALRHSAARSNSRRNERANSRTSRLRSVGLQRGELGLGHGSQAAEQAQVGLDMSVMPGLRIFTITSVPSFSWARCTWAMEAAASGSVSKRANTGFGLAAQVFAQLRQQLGPGHGGHVAVQLLEFGDPLGAEQVRPAGQDLAELDEGRPQFLHRQRTCTGGDRRARSAACSQRSAWPARSSESARLRRRTMSPSPWRISTPRISLNRPTSRAVPRASISMGRSYRCYWTRPVMRISSQTGMPR
jgi:hypothetical protein